MASAQQRAEHRSDDARVIVDDVELLVVQVRGERVIRVVPGVAELAGIGRLGERRDDLRPAARPAAREERDVVARVDETVGEQRDDELDSAVTRWRNRKPDGGDLRDPHALQVTDEAPDSVLP